MEKFLDFIEIFVYGIIQGITEVLPISSSGHLSIANSVLPSPRMNLPLAAVIHAGSLVAITWWFRHDLKLLWSRFGASLTVLQNRYRKNSKVEPKLTAYQKMPYYIGISLLPTAIFGLLLQAPAENMFVSKLWAPSFLFLNGLILLFTAWRSRVDRTLDELNWKDYLLIGTVQGIAVIPGISRLGITLCACLWRGLGWYDSLRLSFILSIPAILGGLIIQLPEVAAGSSLNAFTASELLLGVTLALIFGIIGIKLFAGTLLEKKSLYPLGFYCCMLGAFSLLYLAFEY